MKKTYILAVCLLISLTGKLNAQTTGSIKGIAFDKAAEGPLAFVSVSLHLVKDSSSVDGLLTGSDGRFLFDGVKRGDYFVRLQFLGYETVESSQISVTDNQLTDLGHLELNVKIGRAYV